MSRGRQRGPRVGDGGRLLVTWASATLSLWLAAGLLPGLSATTPWAWVVVAGVTGVVGLVVRPVLVAVSARVGWLAVLGVALVGQALILYAAMSVVPAISGSFRSAFLASWIAAAVGTLIEWITTAGTDDGLVTSLARRGGKVPTLEDPELPGLLVVQADGVPFPVLRWAVQAGAVPNIRRWLGSGSHRLHEWTAQLPCTTPASQLGILHGTVAGVPAFRWYDRELGRVLVANRPADARIIEERATDGRGLLADDGVSISNLFTGDAARSVLTMSRVELSRGSTQTRVAVAWFIASPNGFARSISRTFAEIIKERWQARRQVSRNLEPRTHRGWTFALLRAVTNALLRDLNTALVAEEMRRGTKVIYVDYVDYDEIAHHAGLSRPESLSALDGVDTVLGALERLSEMAPRRYHLVVLSDHGQSQGRSFRDRYDHTLGELCKRLMDQPVFEVDDAVEGWGRAEALAGDVSGAGGMGRLAGSAGTRLERHSGTPRGSGEDAVVLGSGNLGLLYLPGPERLSPGGPGRTLAAARDRTRRAPRDLLRGGARRRWGAVGRGERWATEAAHRRGPRERPARRPPLPRGAGPVSRRADAGGP